MFQLSAAWISEKISGKITLSVWYSNTDKRGAQCCIDHIINTLVLFDI